MRSGQAAPPARVALGQQPPHLPQKGYRLLRRPYVPGRYEGRRDPGGGILELGPGHVRDR